MRDILTGSQLIERFQAIRKAKGLTAEQLSTATGLSRSVIANFESGRRPYITVDEARDIAAALDVDLCDCLDATPMKLTVRQVIV